MHVFFLSNKLIVVVKFFNKPQPNYTNNQNSLSIDTKNISYYSHLIYILFDSIGRIHLALAKPTISIGKLD